MSHTTITLLGALGLLAVALVVAACYVLAELRRRRREQTPGQHRPDTRRPAAIEAAPAGDTTVELPVIPALGMDLETSLSLITAAQQARLATISQTLTWSTAALVRPYAIAGRHRAPEEVAA